MRGNTILMHLNRGQTSRAGELFQYDYGQKLLFAGVTLPESYEVHFSNQEHGSSKTMLGDATGVDIPDEYLTSGDPVHVWVYLHDGADDGETEYHGIIGVAKRAKPTDQQPTPVQQSIIEQAITALNAGVTEVEGIAEGIPQTIDTALAEAKASGEFDGDKGDPGDDGFSPTVAISEITGGHRVTVTDAEGDHPFDVMDGEVSKEELAEKADKIHDTVTDQSVASVPDACVGAVDDLVLQLEPIQAGSGDPSPSNVRAISGRSSVVVKQGRKNLMCGVINHPVAIYSQGDPDTDCIITSSDCTSLIVACKAGVTYTLSGIADRNRGYVGFFETYPEVNSIGKKVTISNTTTDGYRFTAPKDGYCVCYVMNSVVSTATAQIEIGTTATAYEAPNLSNHTANIPTPPGTVYGGEIDWVNGKLKVTHAIIDMGTLSWVDTTASGHAVFRTNPTGMLNVGSSRNTNGCCSHYKMATSASDLTCFFYEKAFYVRDDSYEGADAFKTAITGENCYVCYPIATPVEYDLSSIPDDIMLVFGENNIWIDHGKVKSMTYPCDTKKYIDKKVAELQALILDN